MKEVIEIYSKIVVATFGFIGPSFTLLISIFIEAIEKARAKNEKRLTTMEDLYDELYKNKEGKDIDSEMADILAKNADSKKQIDKEQNLLNPRRQIKRVFIPLISSLFFIACYHFMRTQYCGLNDPFWYKLFFISISGTLFSYCLYVLWQILNMVIDAKQAVIKDKTDQVLKQDSGDVLDNEDEIDIAK